MGETPLIQSMRSAVEAAPNDVPLRTHLARLLLESGADDEAVRHAAAALERDPGSADARDILIRATTPAGDTPIEQPSQAPAGFDWRRAEAQLDSAVPPKFIGDEGESPAFDVEKSGITLADVGGMEDVKQRLEAAFLAPMRNPELRKLYGKTLRSSRWYWRCFRATPGGPSWVAASPSRPLPGCGDGTP